MPDLSVIFGCRDRGDLLDRTLVAWHNQDALLDIEMIVVDDGSVSSLQPLAAQHGAIYLTIPPNGNRSGPSVAWNAGLRAARGNVLACSSPEIIPDRRCARFLHDVPMGKGGFDIYLGNDQVKHPEVLGHWAIKVSVPVFVLAQEHNPDSVDWRADPTNLRQLPNFMGTQNPQMGNQPNQDVMKYGWMPNALFAMRADFWKWMNYLRPSDNWGSEDIELVTRRHWLGLSVVHALDIPYAYHQWHDSRYRKGQGDLHEYKDMEDARLTWMYPETAHAPCPLTHGWADNWNYSEWFSP